MNKQQITDEAIKYCSHIDFTDDKNLSEKGRLRVKEWAKQDFIAGVIKSVCLEGNEPIECDQFTALGNCEKCTHFNKQTVL